MSDFLDPDDPTDWSALARYVAGESPPPERERVEDLLARDESLRQFVHVLQRARRNSRRPTSAPDTRESWERMRRRMNVDLDPRAAAHKPLPSDEDAPGEHSNDITQRRQARWASDPVRRQRAPLLRMDGWIGRAAVLLIGVALTVVAVDLTKTPTVDDEVVRLREVVTDRGQRSTLELGDGTRIVLNAESRLRVPVVFRGGIREVHLEGQAHFDVSHDPDRPFVVHSENGRVQVLGTAFDLRSYRDESWTQVVVVEGSVSFTATPEMGGQTAVLESGHRARLSADGTLGTDEVDAGAFTSWLDGRLVFDDASIDEVATTLSRWYDIEVVVRDESLRDRTISANLRGKYLADVLNVISVAANLRFELEDDRLVLMK